MYNKWVDKLQISYHEEPDGSCVITIEWDEKDPDLQLWNSWGEDKQKQFIREAINLAVSNILSEDETKSLRFT
jgi:hypothetical protein